MAGYKSGQVNVGSLVNPTDALSRSLNNLSNMYGKQASDEQMQLNREQDILRRQERLSKTDALSAKNRKEDLAYKEAGRVENSRRHEILQGEKADARALSLRKADAKEAGNKFFIAANEGRNPDLVETDYSTTFQKDFKGIRDSWDSQEAVSRKAALSGNAEDIEAAVKAMPSGKGVDARETTASQNTRRTNLGILNKAILDAGSDEEKQKILDKGMQDIYGGRRAELNKSIAEGSFLTNKQKVNALMRYAPKDFVRFGDADAMQRNLLGTMSGTTKQELKTAENQRVSARNAELDSAAKADTARYKAELKARKGKSDWKGLGKLLEKDLGNFFSGNNDDKADIVDFMISEGVPHDQITFSVNRLISEASDMFGDSIPDAKDPKVLQLVTGITSDLRKKGLLSDKPIRRPSGYTPEVARSVDEIQKHNFRTGGGRSSSTIQLREGWDKYKATKKELTPPVEKTKADILEAPATGTPATRLASPAYSPNPDVPEGGAIRPVKAVEGASIIPAGAYNPTGNPLGNVNQFFRNAATGIRNAPTNVNKLADTVLGSSQYLSNSLNANGRRLSPLPRQRVDAVSGATKLTREALLSRIAEKQEPLVKLPETATSIQKYVMGGDTFGTNSHRVGILNKAGVPRALAHKAANSREKLTNNEKNLLVSMLNSDSARVGDTVDAFSGAGTKTRLPTKPEVPIRPSWAKGNAQSQALKKVNDNVFGDGKMQSQGGEQKPTLPAANSENLSAYSDNITNSLTDLDTAVNAADKALSLVHPDNAEGRSKAISAKVQAMSKRMEASAKRAAAELLKAGLSPDTIKGKQRELVSKYYSELQEQFLET